MPPSPSHWLVLFSVPNSAMHGPKTVKKQGEVCMAFFWMAKPSI
ncbi:hypothetical protein GBL_1627 [Geobacillus kaustophilus GBlys]|uniref:Uncharacterized protein n=1 Tax=Geobacillus kaustophilus GBlys TaxID=1337888 RepID=U2X3S1_GEOKU|nr:hypothetical protein GBL_1627 [Geobacillus kaustophilus GBlys]